MTEFLLDEISERYLSVEIDPVPLDPYARGNTGVPYVWSFGAREPGPHVMLCAIMHGNEIAGATVLDRMLREDLRPRRGTLTLCFGNPEAYARFDRSQPHLHRYVDTDMNRCWGRELADADRADYEVERARALRPVVETVDALLDIHTMQGRGAAVALVNDNPRALAAVASLTRIPFVLTGTMHEPHRLRLRDFGAFGQRDGRAVAVQVEAGQHWAAESVDIADGMARQFLGNFGLIPSPRQPLLPVQRQLRIVETIVPTTSEFSFADDFANGAFLPHAGTLVGHDGACDVVTPCDDCHLIMPVHFRRPGGSAGRFGTVI